MLNSILRVRGIHYLLTRFGPRSLQRLSFDQKYRDQEWNFKENPASELLSTIQKYSRGGDILMLGCGTAQISQCLDPGSYSSFLGIDLSPLAIEIASTQSNPKAKFQVGDMYEFSTSNQYSVILLSESIYYIKKLRQKTFLKRISQYLTPQGQIVVTISQPTRYRFILEMIRNSFTVSHDSTLNGSKRHMIVFR